MTPAQIRSITLSAKKRYKGDHEDVRQAALLRCLEWEQRNGKALPDQFNPLFHVHAAAAKLGLWGRKLGREVLDGYAYSKPQQYRATSTPSPEAEAMTRQIMSSLSELTLDYLSGASSDDLAKKHGVDVTTVTRRIRADIKRVS